MRLLTSFVLSWLFVALHFNRSCFVFADEFDALFDDFFLEKSMIDDGFSVWIEKTILADEGPESVVATARYQRFSAKQGARIQRIDGIALDLFNENEGKNANIEHQLVDFDNSKSLYYNRTHIGSSVVNQEVRGGKVLRATFTRRKHPFELTITNGTGSQTESQTGIAYHKSVKIIEESRDHLGQRIVLATPGPLGAYQVKFHKDFHWCPIEIKFYSNPREDRSKSPSTPDEVRKWDHYATIQSKWIEIKEHKFIVPEKVTVSSSDGLTEEKEFRFVDWKFGKEVDESLFDQSRFVPGELDGSIDFSSIRKKFEGLSK
ncbi:hypothetical protein SH449x_001961 [Pirellulaceae bacterium SH449]